MENTVVARIRNYVVLVTFVAFLVIFGAVYWWGSGMVSEATLNNYQKVSRVIARSNIEAFLELNYSSLKTTVENLSSSEASQQLGIAYAGFQDNRGRMFVTGISSEVPSEFHTPIANRRLVDSEDRVLLADQSWVKLGVEDQTLRFYEIDFPVKYRGETPGLVKIGFFPGELETGWASFRRRVLIFCFVLVVAVIIGTIFVSQRWRKQIRNLVSVTRNETEQEYQDRINQLERKVRSQPLNSDEFFQIIDFGKRINRTMEPPEVLRYLVNSVVKILSVKQVVIFLISPDNSNLLVGQMGMKEGNWMDRDRLQNIQIEIGSGEIGTIAELGQANILDNPRPGAGVAAALRASGQTIGVVRATEKKSGARMGNKDKLKIRLISQLSGNIIKHAFEFQKLQKSSGVSGE